MQRLEQLSSKIFPSNPKTGKIGSIELNIWLAQLAGVPILGLKYESKTLRLLLLCYGMLMTALITFIYTGFEMYDLYLNWHSLDALTQNICLSLTHVAGLTKSINSFYRLTDIRNVIEKLRYATRKYVVSDRQLAAFYRGELENKIPLSIYAALVASTGMLGICMLFLNPQDVAGEIFPYRVVLPNWLPYSLQLAYMGLSVLIFALQIVSIDYLNVTMINHIRFQLIVLNLTFEELMLGAGNEDYLLATYKSSKQLGSLSVKPLLTKQQLRHANERMRAIVQHHCILIELRNEVEDIFRFPILIQFFTSLVIFALTGFQATVREGGSKGAVLIYFYCGCIFVELFVYCFFGNSVFEQSKTLSTSGYKASWYHFDNSFKKSLLIFLANAQRPFLFTASGFMGLTLPSFAGILSKSYSFIAVLRQIYSR